MGKTKIYAALQNIFQDVFLRDDITLTPETTAKDVEGWDSFKQIEIILALESEYGIKFNTRELDSLKTVGDLVRVVSSKI